MNTTHIMVDLETWGTTPGSDIRSIGAVVFDPVAGTLGDEFYVNVVNPLVEEDDRPINRRFDNAYRRYRLTRDPSTVEWWSQQSEAAQQRLTTDVVDLVEGLGRFQTWWGKHDDGQDTATFWAHGPHFDEAILAACYRATGLPVPWHYRAPRDCRTVFDLAGDPCHVPFEGIEHDALADAKNQALRVIEAYRRIRELREMLRESGELFRMYESSHRAKIGRAADIRDNPTSEYAASHDSAAKAKAERNAAMAARIESLLA